MEAKEQNYGVAGEYGPEQESAEEDRIRRVRIDHDPIGQAPTDGDRTGHGTAMMNEEQERTWSVLSHLSVFLNLVTGFLGPVAALLVWLVYRDKSEKVSFQALQAMWYQVAWVVILGVGWTVTALLTIVLIGFLLIPPMALISLVPFVHGAYAAYRVSKDGEYRYPIIADMIERR